MTRLLLLIPTTSYRTHDFMEAAHRLGIEVVLGSDQRQVLEDISGGDTITIDFENSERGAEQILGYAKDHPIEAIVSVDDGANAVAARASTALGFRHNSPDAVGAARNKYRCRKRLAAAAVPTPDFRLASVHDDPSRVARSVSYPCVLKPLTLAMSRGVIRADGDNSFVAAFHRIAKIIAEPDAVTPGEAADHILIEDYVAGTEYAVEGLIDQGRLNVLAIFDKPDPLEGPFFEETIYVTPARVTQDTRAAIANAAQKAVTAIGLTDGPTHIDLRVNDDGVFIIEVDARSIGGHCGRSLRFGAGTRLEEIILRHATGLPVETIEREDRAGGVMMIPIPKTGILQHVRGREGAASVPCVEEVDITIPVGQPVVTLPDGGRYLGFIIARADTPDVVIAALREAYRRLEFVIEPEADA